MSYSGQPWHPHSLCLPGYHRATKTIDKKICHGLGLPSLNPEQRCSTVCSLAWEASVAQAFAAVESSLEKDGPFCLATRTLWTMWL